MKFANRHLEFERIISAAENASVNFSTDEQNHLTNCSECAKNFRKLKNLFFAAPKEFSAIVPQSVTANLLNIYRKPLAAAQKSIPKRLAGLLVFDDWKPEFALNERLTFQDTRQFLYRAGEYNVDVRINFIDDKYLISGQVFKEKFSAVARIFNDDFSAEAALNEYGEFNFPPCECSVFSLQIILENETIEIKDISAF